MSRLLLIGLLILQSYTLLGFDYLEHAYLGDRGCEQALEVLSKNLDTNKSKQVSAYLALSLFCPVRWQVDYCHSGLKNEEGSLHDLEESVQTSGDYSVTFGDYPALIDHIFNYGKIRGIPNMKKSGLTEITLEWLEPGYGNPGGVVEDVGEEACASKGMPDWARIERDVQIFLNKFKQDSKVPSLPDSVIDPLQRAPLVKGPRDPNVTLAIDNPRYLDLQLFNHSHFGEAAYSTWAGYHYTAIKLAEKPCEEVLWMPESIAEDIARHFPEFENHEFDEDSKEYSALTCRLFRRVLAEKILRWSLKAPSERVNPVRPLLTKWQKKLADKQPLDDEPVLQDIPSTFLSLLIEGGGLHFIQDSFSGGHIRTDRDARGLGETRSAHDIDGKNGVIAGTSTAEGSPVFTAYGDSYLLSRVQGSDSDHFNSKLCLEKKSGSRATNSECALFFQRGFLVSVNAASILDWSEGGLLYQRENEQADCGDTESCKFVKSFLPLSPVVPASRAGTEKRQYLMPGNLPVPLPPIDYETLEFITSFDAAGNALQLGARISFLSELGTGRNWLTSYEFGLLSRIGRPEDQQFNQEFAYMFHYRWAARFLFDLGAFTYTGFEGFDSTMNFYYGLGLAGGISILPEGWTKIPLEIRVTYRAPWRFVDTRNGFASQGVENHWIEVVLGLAFM